MRHEAPVYEVPGMGFFIVSRYDDLQFVMYAAPMPKIT
jgi:hypothetical protein